MDNHDLKAELSAAVEGPRVKVMEQAIATFPSKHEFVRRHGGGAAIEFLNDMTLIQRFNESRQEWTGWVVAPLMKSSGIRGCKPLYLLLVKQPEHTVDLFPKIGEPCLINLLVDFVVDGEKINPGYLDADRIDNPFDGLRIQRYSKMAAFKLLSEDFQSANRAFKLLAPWTITEDLESITQVELVDANAVRLGIHLKPTTTTYDAEISALALMTREKQRTKWSPSGNSKAAFENLLDFQRKPDRVVDLFSYFPHMKDTTSTGSLPDSLKKMFSSLNQDHIAAYSGLSSIPAGLHLVGGCPGAGKTHWNLLVCAAAMAGEVLVRGLPTRPKILYMVDINKPIDDAADRMQRLWNQLGLPPKSIIRMRGWPYEMRNSARLNEDGKGQDKGAKPRANFCQQFLAMAGLARATNAAAQDDQNRAKSLDEVAWAHYEVHKNDKYQNLTSALESYGQGGLKTQKEVQVMRRLVTQLYQAVLDEADFVASSPVATWSSFRKMFRPHLVFLDEAPHARELTCLIPIAFFSPIAWVFSGDYRQTRPFVGSRDIQSAVKDGLKPNPFAAQLLTSTMERADSVGELRHHLMVNHRSYGNLHRLPSKLFYDAKMRAGIPDEDLFPPPVLHVQRWMQSLAGTAKFDETRLIVDITSGREREQNRSFCNPKNHDWIIKRVQELLSDPNFVKVSKHGPAPAGDVMIICPYRAGMANYKAALKSIPRIIRNRISVRTVDTAQGQQADVVFQDFVRTTSPGFLDDPHRLAVSITRARQGEVILISERICTRPAGGGRRAKTDHLSRIWEGCMERGCILKA